MVSEAQGMGGVPYLKIGCSVLHTQCHAPVFNCIQQFITDAMGFIEMIFRSEVNISHTDLKLSALCFQTVAN